MKGTNLQYTYWTSAVAKPLTDATALLLGLHGAAFLTCVQHWLDVCMDGVRRKLTFDDVYTTDNKFTMAVNADLYDSFFGFPVWLRVRATGPSKLRHKLYDAGSAVMLLDGNFAATFGTAGHMHRMPTCQARRDWATNRLLGIMKEPCMFEEWCEHVEPSELTRLLREELSSLVILMFPDEIFNEEGCQGTKEEKEIWWKSVQENPPVAVRLTHDLDSFEVLLCNVTCGSGIEQYKLPDVADDSQWLTLEEMNEREKPFVGYCSCEYYIEST